MLVAHFRKATPRDRLESARVGQLYSVLSGRMNRFPENRVKQGYRTGLVLN